MKFLGIIPVVVYFALLVGWVMNIVSLFHMLDGPVTAMFIMRAVGIFAAPLGGVLGYF